MQLNVQMMSILDRFSGRPALADRRPIPKSNSDRERMGVELLSRYNVLTYGELRRRVEAVSVQLCKQAGRGSLRSGDRAALLGYPGIDFTTVDFACNLIGITTVPLQTSGSMTQHLAILEETTPRLLVVSVDLLDRVDDIISHISTIERILILDYRGGESGHREALQKSIHSARITPEPLNLDSILEWEPNRVDDDHLAMLLYTSGSTGEPKGAMYSARLVGEMWGGEGWSEFFAEKAHVASFHYMPMSHVAGHSSVRSTLSRGGITYFASTTNLSNFFEDLALARPTELSLVPRVCELLHQEYQRRVGSHDGDDTNVRQILDDMRVSVLGGRVEWASCTSAPVSAELKAFMELLLGIELHELYGTTEIGGVLADGRFLSPPVIDYRLDDVPELGYFRSDRPAARGELLIKSTSTVSGYFNRPDLNPMIFTEDGYYRTGDIAAVDPDGSIRIIDRKNAIIKLAQGEFVALPSLEAVYVARSSLLRQVFLYGRSDQSAILAVAVLNDSTLQTTAGEDSILVSRRILNEFRNVAEQENLNSYEVPAAVIIETEPFSEENGLLSDHRKPVRPRLLERYRPRLDAIYDELAANREGVLAELITHGANNDTEDTVRIAAALTLQIDPETIRMTTRFRSLGGDSLTAVHLSRLLAQIYDLLIPVDVLVSESNSLADLAGYINVKRMQNEWLTTFDDIHGMSEDLLLASDLTISKFLSARTKIQPNAVVHDTPQSVLITGASGFLGRFLCLEWLRRFSGTTRRVTCLVRANSDDAARTRLRSAFSTSPELLAEFDSFSDNLEVLAGDLAEPRLGLDETMWESLARGITHILHAGAMVNHALAYRELFAPNVAGTAEVLRLALTGPMKPITFMSSIATALLSREADPLDESVDIREALPEVRATGGIVNGYAATKWASEVLLRDAHSQYALPVTVFRASMILAHSYHPGQINVPDTYTRLLFSLMRTGIVPPSFYMTDGENAHYDGLPVDIVSHAIATLMHNGTSGYQTYHLVNPFDDGISLDRFVDWMIEAGVSLTPMGTYAKWFERFRMALSVLDDDDRRASLLPLLDGFQTPEIPIRGSLINSSNFTAALAETGNVDLVRSLDREFILKTMRDIEFVFDINFPSPGEKRVRV